MNLGSLWAFTFTKLNTVRNSLIEKIGENRVTWKVYREGKSLT